MIRKLMLALAMAAIMCFGVTGMAFAQEAEVEEVEQVAVAEDATGGAGGDATNENTQAGAIVQDIDQVNVADDVYVEADDESLASSQVNVANQVAVLVQVQYAEQSATGGAGGAGDSAAAAIAAAVALDD